MRQEAADAGAADDLGPVILEQKAKPLTADLFLVVALFFLAATVLVDFLADFRGGVVPGPLCGGLGAMFALFGILYILSKAGKASHLHERGLSIGDRKGQRILRFTDSACCCR